MSLDRVFPAIRRKRAASGRSRRSGGKVVADRGRDGIHNACVNAATLRCCPERGFPANRFIYQMDHTHMGLIVAIFRSQTAFLGFLILLAASVAGCGQAPDGLQLFPVSGEITYQGKPVPAGTVTFQPDPDQGGKGPSKSFKIEAGKYNSGSSDGTVGGPQIVLIEGLKGEKTILPDGMELDEGAPLFPAYRTNVTLPEAGHVENFEVPAKRAKK